MTLGKRSAGILPAVRRVSPLSGAARRRRHVQRKGEFVMSDPAEQQPAQSGSAAVQPVIMKFGGTSLEDGAATRRALRIVKQRLRHNPVIVASALADVTDQLLAMGKAAAKGELAGARESLEALQRRHEQVALDVAGPESYEALRVELATQFELIHAFVSSVAAAAELTPRLQDLLLSFGECLSSRIVQAAFAQAGLDAVWVDARACIVTDAAHTQATPLWRKRTSGCKRLCILCWRSRKFRCWAASLARRAMEFRRRWAEVDQISRHRLLGPLCWRPGSKSGRM